MHSQAATFAQIFKRVRLGLDGILVRRPPAHHLHAGTFARAAVHQHLVPALGFWTILPVASIAQPVVSSHIGVIGDIALGHDLDGSKHVPSCRCNERQPAVGLCA